MTSDRDRERLADIARRDAEAQAARDRFITENNERVLNESIEQARRENDARRAADRRARDETKKDRQRGKGRADDRRRKGYRR